MHDNQHRHARLEAMMERFSSKTYSDDNHSSSVGLFDYQCPNAKYLVVSVGAFGLGAFVRHIAVGFLLGGLMSDRVVLFMNSQEFMNNWDREALGLGELSTQRLSVCLPSY
ncbi:hypothetical protein IV203_030375 [Nitzschia inconspicua]|uniref:Uncharacterized protein n=1 Tax=Nitzschia inconspicua TaxID=303405 RepID=A0A9K3LTI3_9STRA|nr:hypothetical protein IV203_030375 [Nitzschia inconspicua]